MYAVAVSILFQEGKLEDLKDFFENSGFPALDELKGDMYSIAFFNPKDIKPTFPENDPPQLDPKTGMHPNYGKQAGRYKKLDPISADSMPPTGDPEIDAVVKKQKTKRTFSKIKKFARGT